MIGQTSYQKYDANHSFKTRTGPVGPIVNRRYDRFGLFIGSDMQLNRSKPV